MDNCTEQIMYKTGWLLLPLTAGVLLIYKYLPLTDLPCMLLYSTGIYCPGCGGTRAVWELLQGNILKSLYYHPFVPYCALLYGWFMISHTADRLSHRRFSIGLKFRNAYLYVGLGIILLNWSLRNLFFPI